MLMDNADPAPVPGCAVYVYYADGLSVAEHFTGPWACRDATAFVEHVAELPGVESVWRVRTNDDGPRVVRVLWRPDPAGPLRPVTPG